MQRSSRVKLALAQIKPTLGNIEENLRLHESAIDEALAGGAGLVVFPELSLTGYFLQDLTGSIAIEPERSEVFARLLELSQRIDVVVGFPEKAPDCRFFNSSAYLSGGHIVYTHRKLYLPTYGMFDEARDFAPGDYLRTFETKFGPAAILICEDLWHPSAAYIAAQDGAELIIGVSAGPGRGVYRGEELGSVLAWKQIIRSVAQAYTVYVVYVNRVGFEDGITFSGKSEVVDPFGNCVAEAKQFDEDLVVASIDHGNIERARLVYPLLRDERLDLTRRELERIYRKRHRI